MYIRCLLLWCISTGKYVINNNHNDSMLVRGTLSQMICTGYVISIDMFGVLCTGYLISKDKFGAIVSDICFIIL